MNPETVPRAEWTYRPNPGFYDEMVAPDGGVRPHWRPLIESLEVTGGAGFARRWQEGRRLIHDNGITYNIYGDSDHPERPWPLDPVPLIMERAEWGAIESAVMQRASLLNAILADLYGPRRLLYDGLLPPELVLANPAFLRPCWQVPVPEDVYLHVYAADLARSPDGTWWVIADRTQAPSGAGYALENRLVSKRVLSDGFRAASIQRLAGFFKTYRETLLSLAPGQRENPRIVVLTPGPYNETYFEHAFLARYLGFTLVEGGDLTVRDNHVYLKTLGGLLPVDLIVRRQDDAYCDPLELRADSMLGVPGLMQALRSRTVTVANALGSGLAESSALSGFLPTLCHRLLGQELKMPTVATWWCGEEPAMATVAARLSELVIKPTFPTSGMAPIFGSRLSKAEREELTAKMRMAPGAYVAQEQVALSTVPVWDAGALDARHLVLRVYAVASGGSYAVMPGGLTRVTTSLDDLVASMQSGGGSKDTWVMGNADSESSPPLSLLRSSTGPLDISRATFDLPSRVADNLFWLGRYVERAEAAVRALRATLPRLLQEPDAATAAGLDACVRILEGLGAMDSEEETRRTTDMGRLEQEVLAMIYDGEARHSLASRAYQVRRVAWLLRDRISPDAWRVLNLLDRLPSSSPAPEPLRISTAQALMDQAVTILAAFSGLAMESMTRGDGWRFLDIGRRLERALQVIELLRHGLGFENATEAGQLEVLLEIADSSITYRSRYLTAMQPELVVDLLLLDEANPRSAAYQMARLRDHMEQLPGSRGSIRRPAEARLALALLNAVQSAEIAVCMSPDSGGRLSGLEHLLNALSGDLRQLSEALTREYFYHAAASNLWPGV